MGFSEEEGARGGVSQGLGPVLAPLNVFQPPHSPGNPLMLKSEAACFISLHSALFLLAAAGCLPFNDPQVSSRALILPSRCLLLSEACMYERNALVLPSEIR